MSEWVYMHPDFVQGDEAKVGVRTHAFNYGTSVFEGIRGYWDQEQAELYIFRLRDHLDRLRQNAGILRMKLPMDVKGLVHVCKKLVRKNDFREDIYLRPIVYKGEPTRLGVNLDDAPDRFLLYTFPLGDYLETDRAQEVTISSWRRLSDNAMPARGKIGGAYVNAALAKTNALRQGFDECIMLTEEGSVAEGSTENLFMVRNQTLITPPVTENILEGITRSTILTLARRELELSVEERPIDRTELYRAQELFFCGTGAEVAGIGQIDQRTIGDGSTGPLTSRIQSLYDDVVRGRLETYAGEWCEPVYAAGDR